MTANPFAALLDGVPRYSVDETTMGVSAFVDADGRWLDRDEVLAALTAALDPALTERAGEVLEGVTPGQWEADISEDGAWTIDAFDGNTRILCSRAPWPSYAEPSKANARFIAWCREGVPALLAQNAALRTERNTAVQFLREAVHDLKVEERDDTSARGKECIAFLAALTTEERQ